MRSARRSERSGALVAQRDAASGARALPLPRRQRAPLVPRRAVRARRRRRQESGAAHCALDQHSLSYHLFTAECCSIHLQIQCLLFVCGDAVLLSKTANSALAPSAAVDARATSRS